MIEIKIKLSMPRIISMAMRVTRATHAAGSTINSVIEVSKVQNS
jgi:hypothetical protein